MKDNNPSSTAGTACAECNAPDPCLFEIKSLFESKVHIWPKDRNTTVKLIDTGEGCPGIIKITPKCKNHSCHKAILKGGKEDIDIPQNVEKNVTLHFKNADNDELPGCFIKPVWD